MKVEIEKLVPEEQTQPGLSMDHESPKSISRTKSKDSKLPINERRSKVRAIIDHVMVLYLPLLRDHTRKTKIKKDLDEKHEDLCKKF